MNYLHKLLIAFIEIAAESSSWLLLGFLFAGLIHEFISVDKMVKHFGSKGFLSVLKASIIGVFLPMCSCGVIPAGIGMYKTGSSVGSTLAFMTSTPAVNPAAIALSLGLLGPKITIAYVMTAFVSSLLIGLIANRLSGDEMFYNKLEAEKKFQLIEFRETSFTKRVLSAFRWGILDLGIEVSYYIFIGFLIAALITAFIPSKSIEHLLGTNNLISLLLTALIGIPIYVCAVGSIPLVASLIAKGALPGISIVFLMAGPATNAAELIAIFKSIGKKAALIYVVMIFVFSVTGGYLANFFVGKPQVTLGSLKAIEHTSQASKILENYYCSTYNLSATVILFGMMAYSLFVRVKNRIERR